jgi:hypothetical protein
MDEDDDPIDEDELLSRQSDRAEVLSWVERLYAHWNSRHAD